MKKTNFVVFFLFFLLQVTGQVQSLYFKHITKDDGLSSNKVLCITQDKTGFMWFGTEDGLTRYDGTSFEIFRNNPEDTFSLTNNYVNCVLEDLSDGNLWVGTNKGLNYFNKASYRFEQNFKNYPGEKIITEGLIQAVFIDHNKNLWVGTNVGVYVYFGNNDIPVAYKPNTSKKISGNSVRCIMEDSKGNLWIGTNAGVEKFDWKTKTFTTYPIINERVAVLSISEDSKHNLWVSTNSHGVFRMSGNVITRYCKENGRLRDNKVQGILEDDKGKILLAVRDGGGLYYLDPQTDKIEIFSPDVHEPGSISSGTLLSLYRDKFSNIWIGTWRNGLDLIEKNRKPFLHYKINFKPDGLINNYVRSVFQDSDGDIWIGTRDNGCLSKFDPKTGKFVHYKSIPKDNASLSSSYVLAIGEAKTGMLLVGTFNGGLNLFDKKTGKFTHYLHNPADTTSLFVNNVYAVFKDRYDTLWIATVNRMQIFDIRTRKFKLFEGASYIRCIIDYSEDEMYFGGSDGLCLYNRKKRTITNYLPKRDDPSSLSHQAITGIAKDSYGNLWISTFGGGLNHFDTKTKKFKAYTVKNGLPNNLACAVLVDNKNKVWVCTTNGLSKFDPVTLKFRNYNVSDGLQGNEFERYVGLKTKDGHLIFGGSNGFNNFFPDSIKDNPVIPRVVITGLKLFNKQVTVIEPGSPLKEHISVSRKLTLNHKQSVITFEFSAINFSSPEHNQYAFKLEPLETDWNYTGNQHSATYTSLPSGDYVFKVKASNNDGIWNERPVSLAVKVLPPPWKSWWAYLGYTIFVCSIIYFLIKEYNIRRDFKLKMEISRIEKEKLEELNRIKLQFFTNISHEFKTPLTLILSPLKKIIDQHATDDKIVKDLGYINRNAIRLQQLINQLMEFRSMENKNVTPVYRKDNFSQFLENLISIFVPLAQNHRLEIKFTSSPAAILTYFDADKTEKIFCNLLSNAVKFTPEGEKIEVNLFQSENEPKITVKITNTNSPIKSEDLPHIFENFYHIDRLKSVTQASSGIGLAYTKELVELLGGEIKASSNDSVTTFKVVLPYLENIEKHKSIDSINSTFQYTQDLLEITRAEKTRILENKNNIKKGPGILIVEDDKELREFLMESFSKDYKVFLAADGGEGLALAEKVDPALIISDILMPKVSGIELCHQIKTNISTSHVPVILLTASGGNNQKIIGMETGADVYIEKPFDIDFLLLQVKNIITLRESIKLAFSKKISPEPEILSITSADEEFVKKAISVVESNMDNPEFDVESFVKAMNVGRTLLYKKIKALTDLSINDFIINIRLKRAAQLLKESDFTISEVAYQVGFNSVSYFSTYFKKHFKITPSVFVEKHKKEPFN